MALYGDQVLMWQDTFPGGGEDGAKNYFTAAFHIEHDKSLSWFSGMNYPWGEHVVYTDNQPLISNALKIFGGPAELIPYLILLSAWIGGWLLFRIVWMETKVRWFAMISSIGIILLSPQLERIGGHYSLAYVGIIPIFLYLIWKRNRINLHWKNAALAVAGWLSGWIHPYLMMMMAAYWFCLNGLEYWFVNQRSIRSGLAVIFWPLLPILIYRIVLWWSDPVLDRPDEPFGFLVFRASWASIFLPIDHRYFQLLGFGIEVPKEGGFYIGAAALITIIIALIRFKHFNPNSKHHLIALASVPILLIALAFPFYLPKLDRLLPFLGPFQQFRGIGRFAFMFYFAINLFAFIEIGQWFKKQHQPYSVIAASVALLILSFDVYSFSLRVITKSGVGVPHYEESLSKIDSTTYQCILPIPFFHIGSEWLRSKDLAGWKERNFRLSYATGIPLASVQLSRTSLRQTLFQKELTSFYTARPKVLEHYTSQPILLVKSDHFPISAYEQKLLDRASPIIGEVESGLSLYSLSVNDFDSIAAMNRTKITSRKYDSTGHNTLISLESFDNLPSKHIFSGDGAKRMERIEWTDIFPKGIHLDEGITYELSFWWKAETQEQLNTELWYWERNGREEVKFHVSQVSDHIHQVIGDWVLCVLPISVSTSGNTLEILAHRNGKNTELWIDEIMLRNISDDYFRPDTKSLNNRYLSSFQPPTIKE
ncbi:MAG: hypothetical protein Salg2KO_15440 [Salibacteraceae bacterium]